MANFILTFRLKQNSTYQSRYESFVKKVKEIAPKWIWEETSSFYAFETDGSADSVCHDLYYGTSFDEDTDLMVILDVGARKFATRGRIENLSQLKVALGIYS